MTTIAWDGTSLAADRCAWQDGVRSQIQKLHVIVIDARSEWGDVGDKLIIAHMGYLVMAETVRNSIIMGTRFDIREETGYHATVAVAVVVDKFRNVWEVTANGRRLRTGLSRKRRDDGTWPEPFDDQPIGSPVGWQFGDYFCAFGSGAQYAGGALAAGATAQQAIELTAEHTDFAGYGHDVVLWDNIFLTNLGRDPDFIPF